MPNTFKRTTEESSLYNNIENLSTNEILTNINKEDQKVAYEVEKVIQPIQLLVDAVTEKLRNGGRLFYLGAGTSGRLGLVDASECPPTFGVPSDLVIGVIAGGHQAMFQAVENAEDAEGVALAEDDVAGRFIVVSSQGDNAYSVYRADDDSYVGRFRIGAGVVGATEETDGIEVIVGDFGPQYPGGLFVAQDGMNAQGAQNFKLVAWDDIKAALGIAPSSAPPPAP